MVSFLEREPQEPMKLPHIACCVAVSVTAAAVYIAVRPELLQRVLGPRMVFFGKVQDQCGRPVAGARVDFFQISGWWEHGSKRIVFADRNGEFYVENAGGQISLAVTKEGYDRIDQQSNAAFPSFAPVGPQGERSLPTKDNPAVFLLRKKADGEP